MALYLLEGVTSCSSLHPKGIPLGNIKKTRALSGGKVEEARVGTRIYS